MYLLCVVYSIYHHLTVLPLCTHAAWQNYRFMKIYFFTDIYNCKYCLFVMDYVGWSGGPEIAISSSSSILSTVPAVQTLTKTSLADVDHTFFLIMPVPNLCLFLSLIPFKLLFCDIIDMPQKFLPKIILVIVQKILDLQPWVTRRHEKRKWYQAWRYAACCRDGQYPTKSHSHNTIVCLLHYWNAHLEHTFCSVEYMWEMHVKYRSALLSMTLNAKSTERRATSEVVYCTMY